jgi:hypothetical protein
MRSIPGAEFVKTVRSKFRLIPSTTVACTSYAIGFFNKADMLESSSILIYPKSQTSLYTELGWRKAALIKCKLKA